MSEWGVLWAVVVLVVVLIVGLILYVRRRDAGGATEAGDPSRDYRAERETGRLAGMSESDREWEAASLERSHRAPESEQAPPADSEHRS